MNYYPYIPNNAQYAVPQAQYMPQQPQQTFLNGKIVDSLDVVKATEVPIGGYGFFPKADLSEIYIKTWNQNGTTNIMTFRPYTEPTVEKVEDTTLTKILDRINELDEKLNNAIVSKPQTTERGNRK